MQPDMPPFSAVDDPDIRNAVDWLSSFADPADLGDRLEFIERQLLNIPIRRPKFRQIGYDQRDWPDDDQIAWYIHLALAALEKPFDYEPREGSRVLPILKRLGMDLEKLEAIPGVRDRVTRLLSKQNNEADAILFELLVAVLWKVNGFETIEFLDESPSSKTPDLRASNQVDDWFIECKRLNRYSQYTRKERSKWHAMWSLLSDHLVRARHSVILDIRFHVELSSLPDDFLATQIPGKLKLVQPPAHLVSNNTMDVLVSPTDYVSANRHLSHYWVRCPSDQLDELVGGKRDPNRGFSGLVSGDFRKFGSAEFLNHLSFAAGAFWDCDAPAAVMAKARHVRSRLAAAIDQLPDNAKGAVHIAIETIDGAMVEEARSLRNRENVFTMHSGTKDLRWVCCHLLQFYAPPRDTWVVDETVDYFAADFQHPLTSLGIFPSDGSSIANTKHWRRPPP